MPTYAYKAVSRAGDPVTGVLDATSRDDALQKVLEIGYLPQDVRSTEGRKANGSLLPKLSGRGRGGNAQTALANVVNHLAALLNAGVPLATGLPLAAETTPREVLRETLNEVQSDLKEGQAFSEALAQHPDTFGPLMTGLVRAGERSGQLGPILGALSDYLNKMVSLRRAIVSAIIYPALLLTVTIIAIVGMLIFVLPEFEPLLATAVETPWHTQALFAVSNALRSSGWVILGIVVVMIAGGAFILRTPSAKDFIRNIYPRLPILGGIAVKGELARLMFTLSTCIKGGLPLLEAARLGQGTMSLPPLKSGLEDAAASLHEGGSLSSGLSGNPYFPASMVRAIRVGEESGRLSEVFHYLSAQYSDEVDESVKRALSILEPCLIILLGLIVGGMVASIMSAVFAAQAGVL